MCDVIMPELCCLSISHSRYDLFEAYWSCSLAKYYAHLVLEDCKNCAVSASVILYVMVMRFSKDFLISASGVRGFRIHL